MEVAFDAYEIDHRSKAPSFRDTHASGIQWRFQSLQMAKAADQKGYQ